MTVKLKATSIEHPQYTEFKTKWKLIRDAVAGKQDIDAQGETYLPRPKGYTDTRYESYQTRAYYFNATSRTLSGFLGALFRKDATVELPEKLSYLQEDTDGEGNTLVQFSKKTCRETISEGRLGILCDYPMSENITSLAEERSQFLRAQLLQYTAESILNWKTMKKGSKTILSNVLLHESEELSDGSHVFNSELGVRYRLLELDDDGYYVQRILREKEELNPFTNKKEKYMVEELTIKPTWPDGKRLDFIPFQFVGSETFTPSPDHPPLYDMAMLNIALYRNSADFEAAVFMVGQPTPWISGLDERFIEENKGQLVIGSNAAWLLPDGAQAGLLESKADKNLIQKAMEQKVSELVGLGARVIQDNSSRGSESTESVQLRRSGEASQLECIADNVSIAMVNLFKWAGKWMGVPDSELEQVKFQLNKDFFSARLSHNDVNALISAWQSGAIPHDTVLDNLRRGEIISELTTNEEIMSEIEDEEPALGTFTEPTKIEEDAQGDE